VRQTLGAEFLSNVVHTNIACLPEADRIP